MKKEYFKIHLTYSCNQSWSDLDGFTESRHCSKCAKNVTDIIGKSDHEIIRLLQEGKKCVRLTKDQLDKSFVISINRNINIPFIRTFALASFTLIAVNSSKASEFMITPMDEIEQHVLTDQVNKTLQFQEDTTKLEIRGKLIDKETKEPILFANVLIAGTELATVTDLEGNFVLTVPKGLEKDTIRIEVSFIGYQTTEFQLTPDDIKNGIVDLEILEENVFLGVVTISKDNEKTKRRKNKDCR